MNTIVGNMLEEDINIYLKTEKNISDEDINEVQMILSMMDEAITLYNMKKMCSSKR